MANPDEDAIQAFLREEAAANAPRVPTPKTAIVDSGPPMPGGVPITEKPQYTKPESFAIGAGRGATFDFADEIGGATVAGAASLPPAARDTFGSSFLQATMGLPGPTADALLTLTPGYEQARDLARYGQHQASAQNPISTGAGLVTGGLATAPLAPGANATTVPRALGQGAAFGAGAGALAGAGASEADTVGGVLADSAKSGVAGGVLGAAGGLLAKYLGGRAAAAQARDDARLAQGVGISAKTAGRAKVNAEGVVESGGDDLIATVRSDPALRAARGNPRQAAEVAAKRMEPWIARKNEIYEAADAASQFKGVDATAAKASLTQALDRATKTGAPPAELNRLRQVIKQFDEITTEALVPDKAKAASLRTAATEAQQRAQEYLAKSAEIDAAAAAKEAAGKLSPAAAARVQARAWRAEAEKAAGEAKQLGDESARFAQGVPVPVVKGAALRAFITDRLAPTGAEKLSGASQAVQDAALALKDQLAKHVGKAAGELDQLNKNISTYTRIQEGALRRFDKTRYTPQKPPTIREAAGERLDRVRAAGTGPAIEAGARMGATQAAGRAGATQLPVKATGNPSPEQERRRAVARDVMSAAEAGDRQRGQQVLTDEVFGGAP